MSRAPLVRALLALLVAAGLGACGRPQPEPTPTPPAVRQAPTPPAPQPEVLPAAATPVGTPGAPVGTPGSFTSTLVDITAPNIQPSPTGGATVSNSPLVVQPVSPTIQIQVGSRVVSAELATTPEQRELGLMYRTSMPEDSGMLFVFPAEQSLSFWMRNTALPLSIAFITSDGTILNIQDMQPYDDQNFHNSGAPARYALEVNQGWFAKAGVAAGARLAIDIPPDVTVR